MANLKLSSLIVVTLFPAGILSGLANNNTASEKLQSASRNQWSWTQAKRTDDEKPFRKIRYEIDQASAKGRVNGALLSKYRNFAFGIGRIPLGSSVPNSILLNSTRDYFRWWYAAYKATSGTSGQNQNLNDVYLTLSQTPVKNYEVARLRFMLETRRWPYVPELKTLGKRLLKHNPNDPDVIYYSILTLTPSRSVADEKSALIYAQKLVRMRPKRPSSHAILGFANLQLWRRTKNETYARRGIAGYEHYLKLAPAKDAARANYQKVIDSTRRMIQ